MSRKLSHHQTIHKILQNTKFEGNINSPIYNYQTYISNNKNYEYNINKNKKINESPFVINNFNYYIHKNNDLMNQLNEEKQKNIKLVKELKN